MSQLVDASEIRELAAGIERQQVMDIVRGATFVGTLLLGWISLHPFESLGDMQIGDVSAGNELATYAMFGALSVLTIALAMRNDARGLATLLSPAFVPVRRLAAGHGRVVIRSGNVDQASFPDDLFHGVQICHTCWDSGDVLAVFARVHDRLHA